jgi:hypothetical protein
MTTLPQGVQIPLQVICEGEPVLLESADALRRLRSYLDGWIGIYEKAEKLPQLSPMLSTSTTTLQASTDPPNVSPAPQHMIDYIVLALQTLGDPLPIKAVYYHILTLGWTTESPDLTMALRNLENTARKYKDVVVVRKGTIRLVKRI